LQYDRLKKTSSLHTRTDEYWPKILYFLRGLFVLLLTGNKWFSFPPQLRCCQLLPETADGCWWRKMAAMSTVGRYISDENTGPQWTAYVEWYSINNSAQRGWAINSARWRWLASLVNL